VFLSFKWGEGVKRVNSLHEVSRDHYFAAGKGGKRIEEGTRRQKKSFT